MLDNTCCGLILILEALSINLLSCASFSCSEWFVLYKPVLFLHLTLAYLCFSQRSRYNIKISELLMIASMKESLLPRTSSVSKPGQSFFKTRVALLILKVSPIFLLHFGRWQSSVRSWVLCYRGNYDYFICVIFLRFRFSRLLCFGICVFWWISGREIPRDLWLGYSCFCLNYETIAVIPMKSELVFWVIYGYCIF